MRRSIVMPRASWIASAMSCEVTEPNRRPSSPAWCGIVSTVLLSSSALSCGARGGLGDGALGGRLAALAAASIEPLVAGSASLRGIR